MDYTTAADIRADSDIQSQAHTQPNASSFLQDTRLSLPHDSSSTNCSNEVFLLGLADPSLWSAEHRAVLRSNSVPPVQGGDSSRVQRFCSAS